MMNQDTVLVVDAGNTSVKIAVFFKSEIVEIQRFEVNDISRIEVWLKNYQTIPCILSSVLSFEATKRLEMLFSQYISVNNEIPLPIKLNYSTP